MFSGLSTLEKNQLKSNWLCVLFVFGLMLNGCSSSNDKTLDGPTFGEITIAVDESFKPLIDSQVEAFESMYKRAKIKVIGAEEGLAMNLMLKDSARLAIVSRELKEDELAIFDQLKIKPRVLKIAEDGLAIILHPSNPDSLLTLAQLEKIAKGEIQNWKGVSGKGNNSAISLVFDKGSSSNYNYFQKKFKLSDKLSSFIYAAGSNLAVIDYVRSNPQAIGVVGVGWISDKDDTTQLSFRKGIVVASIAQKDTTPQGYFQPYQAYLAQKVYPLSREVLIVSREARVGLGTGFSAFVAADRGQRIFLKAGLLPATMPIRLIQTTKDSPYDK